MTKYLGIAMVFVSVVLSAGCAKKSDSGSSGQNALYPVTNLTAAVPGDNDPEAVPDETAGDVCTSYVEKRLACAREAIAQFVTMLSDSTYTQEKRDRLLDQEMDQQRDRSLKRCEYLRIAGVDVLSAAIRACADSPCGDNNATNWDTCIITKIDEHPTTRKSASDPDSLAQTIRGACIAEDYRTIRSYMPNTEEVAQAFSGGHGRVLGPGYSGMAAARPMQNAVACPCFASLGNAAPEAEVVHRTHFARGDDVEDGAIATRDVDFARARMETDSEVLHTSSGDQRCHLSLRMINFGDGWKLLLLDT